MVKHKFATCLVLRHTHVRCQIDLTGAPVLIEYGRKRAASSWSCKTDSTLSSPPSLLTSPVSCQSLDTKRHCQDSIHLEVLVLGLSCKLSAARRSRPHQRQLDHECDGVQYHSPLGREAELVLVSQSWEIHAHDRATFSVNLLIFLLTHTAAT